MAKPLLQRSEIKYVISEDRVEAIRTYMRPYMRLDPYSTRKPGWRYAIASLYLDTTRLELARETSVGIKQRFKARIRAYDDRPDSPVFCEIKHRDANIIRKTRVAIPRGELDALRRGTAPRCPLGEKDRATVADFQTRIARWGLRPRAVVRYDREAYEAIGGAPVRVTFDRFLRRRVIEDWSVPVDECAWDVVPWTSNSGALVLEVKFDGQAPLWVRRMIQQFELRQRGHGKYVLSVADGAQPRSHRAVRAT